MILDVINAFAQWFYDIGSMLDSILVLGQMSLLDMLLSAIVISLVISVFWKGAQAG